MVTRTAADVYWSVNRRYAIALVLAIGVAIAVVALVIVVRSTPPGPSQLAGVQPVGSTCGEPSAIALVGRVAAGHSASDLQIAETATAPSNDPSLVVIVSSAAKPPTLSSLGATGIFKSVGYIRSRSLDPTIESCNYKLLDSPGAVALARPAEAAMVQQNLITEAQLRAESTILIVTDDPTQSGKVFVAAMEAGIGQPYAVTMPTIVATVDRKSGRVDAVGVGNWYAGR